MKKFNEFVNERLKSMFSFNNKVINLLKSLVGDVSFKSLISSHIECIIETKYGKLNIILDNDKSEVYSIFMRFEEGWDTQLIKDIDDRSLNKYSGKWNIHTWSEEEALGEFEKRITMVI